MPAITITHNSGKGLQGQVDLSGAAGLYTLSVPQHLLTKIRISIPAGATGAGVTPKESHDGSDFQELTDAADASFPFAANTTFQVLDAADGPVAVFGLQIPGSGSGIATITAEIV